MVLVWGNAAQLLGAVVSPSPPPLPAFVLAFTLLGIGFGVGWPGFNALTSSIVSGPVRTQFFGINFALVNLGIGIGGIVSGFLTDVDRPGTFTAIFLVDAACVTGAHRPAARAAAARGRAPREAGGRGARRGRHRLPHHPAQARPSSGSPRSPS